METDRGVFSSSVPVPLPLGRVSGAFRWPGGGNTESAGPAVRAARAGTGGARSKCDAGGRGAGCGERVAERYILSDSDAGVGHRGERHVDHRRRRDELEEYLSNGFG